MTRSDVPVVSIRVAISRDFQPKGEERKSDFVDVTAWKQTAEFISKFFRKGQIIAVDGRLETEDYTDREGNKRQSVRVTAQNVYFGGDKKEDSESGPVRNHQSAYEEYDDDDADNDVPF